MENTSAAKLPRPDASSPKDVVERAVEYQRRFQRRMEVAFDQVWCVFDHDAHGTFEDALNEAAKAQIRVAYSIPCFEFWYLLHFEYDRPFRNCRVESTEAAYQAVHKGIC